MARAQEESTASKLTCRRTHVNIYTYVVDLHLPHRQKHIPNIPV